MKRICPSNIILAEYLRGGLPGKEREKVELHLVHCKDCRHTVIMAHDVLKKSSLRSRAREFLFWPLRNIWFSLSCVMLLCSFLLPSYFLQFIALSLLSGIKWVLDSRSSKMLIMTREALRDSPSQDKRTKAK